MKQKLLLFAVFGFLVQAKLLGANCAGTQSVTISPASGCYAPGQTVQVCYTMTGYNQTNSNWFHGLTFVFGAGWNTGSVTVVSLPPSADGSGNWNYYPGGQTASATNTAWGAGFYYDSNLGGALDGNPGNNFGDNSSTATWTFCFSVQVNAAAPPGSSLNLGFIISGDGASGSWTLQGCQTTPNFTLSTGIVCNGLTVTASQTNVTCNGLCNGTATATASNGTIPYTYLWNTVPQQATATANNLCAGTYICTVHDNTAASATVSVTITQPVAPNVTITPPAALTCALTTTNLSASSTTPGVTYHWSNGANTAATTTTTPGTYTVTVTQSPGNCTATASVTVTQNITPPNVSIVPPGSLNCNAVTVNLTGSSTTVGATYHWSTGATTSTISVATPGAYTLTVTNPANGCTASQTVNVTQTVTVPNVTITPPAQITCTAPSVTITANSTTVGATFQWAGGPATATKTVNAAGTYTVTVTDPSDGCTASATVSVTQNGTVPTAVIAPPTQLTCSNTTVTLSASSNAAGATFQWGGGGPATATYAVTTGGTYTVTVTNPANGCTASATTTVTQNTTPPNVSIAAPGVLNCTNTTITLQGSSTTPGVTYQWSGGPATANYGVTTPGTYTLTVTNPANGCTASASATVTQNIAVPNVSIAPPAVLTCAVASVTLTASSTTPGVTYSWVGGPATATKTVATAGTYTVTVTDPSNGCTASVSTTVTQNHTAPNASIAPPATLTCAVSSVTLTASSTTPGVTYQWVGGPATNTYAVGAPGTYTVTVTDPSNGCTTSVSATVIQTANVPNVSIAPPAQLTCTVVSVTLTASSTTPGVTYSWVGGPATATKTVNAAGTYTVTVTDPSNGCSASASVAVVQNITPPNISIAAPGTLTCATTTVTLTGSSTTPGATFHWVGGPATATYGVTTPGTYTLTVTDPANGCTASMSTTVTQNITAPNISIAVPATLTCAVTTVTLTGSSTTPGATFQWVGGPATATYGVTTPGTYTLTVTDPANGCTASLSTTVAQNIAVPNVSIAPPAQLTCTVATVTLSASSTTVGVTYLWGDATTAATDVVGAAGNYGVTVTNPANGCTASATTTVTQAVGIPNVSIAAPATLTCAVTTVTLTASSTTVGVTFQWVGGPATANYAVTTPGTYTVTVTDPSNGCSASASATVTQNITTPDISIAAPATLTCTTTTVTLTGASITPGATFQWVGGPATATYGVTTPGTYTLTVTDPANGCTASMSTTVTQNIAVPNIAIAAPATLTCAVTTVTLTGSSTTVGATFQWVGGPATATYMVNAPGTYTLTVTDPANGCTASLSSTVTQNIAVPNVSIAPPAQLTCTVATVTLSGSSTTVGVTYLWDDGTSATTDVVGAAGNYGLTVTDPSNGCTASATTTVIQAVGIPNVSIAAPATLTCAVTTVTLTASSTTVGVTFQWVGGPATANYAVTTPGTYTVTVTDPSNGCSASASATVAQNITTPDISIAAPATLTCTTTTVTLTGASITPGATFQWVGGPATATYGVTTPGTYTLTVTDPANGCTASMSTMVTQNITVPNIAIAAPATLTCAVTTVTLTGSSTTAGATFQWVGGPATATYTVNAPGTYTLTVTDPANGCTASLSSTVAQNIATPNITIAPPAQITCAVTTVTLTANSTTPGVTYLWDDATTGTTDNVGAVGNYGVTVTDPTNGCTASATTTVTQAVGIPDVSIAVPATLTCAVTTVTLTASSTVVGVNFQWVGGPATATYAVTTPGTYTVTVTDPSNGCSASTSTTVTQNITTPDVTVVPPTTLTCAVTTVTLSASSTVPGATFVWDDGTNGANDNVTAPGNVGVTVTDPGNGCTASVSTAVTQNIATPDVTIAPPATLTCAVTTITLTASSTVPGATFVWDDGTNGSTDNITVPGNVGVTVTDPANGCTANTSTAVIQDITAPNVSIAPPAILTCATNSVTLTASSTTPGATFVWDDGTNGATDNVTAPGNVGVTATDPNNGCTASTSVTVTQNVTPPDVTIAPPATLTCAVTTITLTASSTIVGATFVWDDATVGATDNVSAPGNIGVTVTDPSTNCSASTSTIVPQDIATPDVTIAPPATLTCAVTTITLTASSTVVGATFVWDDATVGATDNLSAPGNVGVTVTDPNNGCTANTSTTVPQDITAPDVAIAPPATLTCAVTTITLTASSSIGGVTFVWDDATTGPTDNVSASGNVGVTATDPNNGCTANTSVAVPQDIAVPDVTVAPPATLTCAVTTVTLTASSTIVGATFVWDDATAGSTDNVSAPGNDGVTVTDPNNGCTASLSTPILQDIATPDVTVAPPATLTCLATTITLSASSTVVGATFVWDDATVGPNDNISAPGNIGVTVTDPNNGCTASVSTAVAQSITPPDVAIAPPATLTCAVTTVTLTASSSIGGVTFLWDDATTNPTDNVTAPGNYGVTATDPSNSCSASTTTTVSQDITAPDVSIAPPATLTCAVTTVTLTASSGVAGVTFIWDDGTNAATDNITAPGNVGVTATDPNNGCTANASVAVPQDIATPDVSVTPPATLTCAVTTVSLTASSTVTGATFVWDDATNAATDNVTAPGNDGVTVTDPNNGCTASLSTPVLQDIATPDVTVAPPATLTCSVTTITLNASSTVVGATFVWDDATVGPTDNISAPGNIGVTVTDPNNGCTASVSTPVAQSVTPPDVAIAPPATLTCAVTTVTLTASSSIAGVTFLWDDATTNPTDNVTAPGNYGVTATDPSNACTANTSTAVAQDTTAPDVSIVPPATLTCAVTTVTLTASSAVAGVTFMWDDGTNTANDNVIAPGNVGVTATDPNNGCTANASIAVPQNITVPDVSVAPPATLTCAVTTVTLTASSTVPGATFVWDDATNGANDNVTAPGNDGVTVTDPANGCTASLSTPVLQDIATPDVTVAPPASLTCVVTTIVLNASSTVGAATFVWDDGTNGSSDNITAPGNIGVTVTDPNNGCTASLVTPVIQDITAPNVSVAPPAQLTCVAPSVTLSASSTTPGATFVWDDGTLAANDIVNVIGNYGVTATDPNNGCTASVITAVTQSVTPPDVTIAPPATLTCAVTTVTLTASSTVVGVTFVWDDATTLATDNITAPGNVGVTATDPSNGCTANTSANVPQDITTPDLTIAAPATLTCTVTTVTLSASSITVGVQYLWDDGTTNSTDNVTAPGTIGVTVTDPNNGCTFSGTASVVQDITTPNVSVAPPATLTCVVTTISLDASSTTVGATYLWDDGTIVSSDNVTSPGNIGVTVTDPNNGCTVSAITPVIQDITAPNLSVAPPATLTCANPTVTLTASSTTPAATFIWDDATTNTTDDVTAPGNYGVTATDPNNGCTASIITPVAQNVTPPDVSIAPPATLTCAVTTVTLTASSTVVGVTYVWDDASTNATDNVSAPGTVGVTATDPADGCSAATSVNVPQNITAPDVSIAPPATLTCAVTTVTLTASSSVAGVTYVWDDATTNATDDVTAPGTVGVTATDPNNGCTASTSANVPQNITTPTASISPLNDTLTCANPTVTLTASSSASGATFIWTDGSSNVTDLISTPGAVDVTVTDPANGCTATTGTTIYQPLPLGVTEAQTEVTCFGTATGSITLTTSGGTAPFVFAWNDAVNSQNRVNLIAGTYSVTVSDINTCTVTGSYTITQPAALNATEVHTNISCNGGSNGTITVSPSGGTTPYAFLWNNGNTQPSPTGLPAGTYTMVMSDSNLCTYSITVTLTEPTALAVTTTHTDASCFGFNDGSCTSTVTGGTNPYAYLWSNGSPSSAPGGLTAGNYTLTVTDNNTCTITTSVVIGQPAQIILGNVEVDPSCPQKPADGNIQLNPSGTFAPYSFIWSNGATSGSLYDLAPGTYSVTVLDAHNCPQDTSFTLAYQYDFSIQATPGVTIKLADNTILGYTLTGNSGTIVNAWTPSTSLSCSDCVSPMAAPVTTTLYTIEVKNVLGCIATDTVTVTVIPDYSIFVPNVFTPNGDGNNDLFEIYGNLHALEFAEVNIFNRWGEKVYESNDHYFKWDGQYKGSLVPNGVYIYEIKLVFIDGHREQLLKGSITVIR